MRAGMRDALLRIGAGIRRMPPRGLLALLAAGAFAPVIAATASIAGVGLAVVGVAGSVGANVLTDLISDVIGHLHMSSTSKELPRSVVEQELVERIEAVLDAGGNQADKLQAELAQVLREIGISQAVIAAVVESGNQESRLAMEEAFASLSADFAGFGFLLTDVSNAAVSIQETLQRQDVEHEADRQLLRQQSAQLALLRQELAVIERQTRYLYGIAVFAGSDQETARAADFEERYRRGIRELLDRVELFGLDLPRVPRSFRLGTAYVRLLLEQTGPSSRFGEEGLHLEDLLTNHQRILVEGAAGSGKSTVLRHLGLSALDGDLAGGLPRDWSLVPFFLKLRAFVHGDAIRLPGNPDEFISSIASPLSKDKPENWVSVLLGKGRAIVLIDGIDEIREADRPSVLDWLQQLTVWYPEAFYVATARPAAVKEQWRDDLRALGFVTARLEPMTSAQVEEFVDRWYRAAVEVGRVRNSFSFYLEPADGELIAARLKSDLTLNSDLQGLVTTPLLCAVVCAVYLNRRRIPRRRTELYETALNLLFERRDVMRGLRPSFRQLRSQQSRPMLSRIALWMLMTGQDAIPHPAALTAIADSIGPREFGHGELLAKRVERASYIRQQLLEQTGLVQEVGKGLIEFRYPSFQDYLAAAEIIRQDLIEYLIRSSHIPTYREVAVNVMELADLDTGRRLLTGLIERAEQENDPTSVQQLWLLAADCLDSVEYANDLVDRIQTGFHDMRSKDA
jgi:hypothetical protein